MYDKQSKSCFTAGHMNTGSYWYTGVHVYSTIVTMILLGLKIRIIYPDYCIFNIIFSVFGKGNRLV